MPTVLLPGTLDTKGREYEFARTLLARHAVSPLVIDFGILGEPAFPPDISAVEVARAGGATLEALRFTREGSDTRVVALETMTAGLIQIVAQLHAEGRCAGILGLGGSSGSTVISAAMRTLPLGVPKLLLSTMASGNVAGFVGTRDLYIGSSVTDIAGLNRVSRKLIANAVNAIVGMALGAATALPESHQPLVAITMFGVTTPGVLRVVRRLEEHGFETIVFHAVGSGGRSMEAMIDEGLIDAVIDYTTSELTDHHLGGIFSAGPHRLEAAARRGLPQVVVPGSLEVLNFGPRQTLPPVFDVPERRLIVHNANVCAVRTNVAESAELGRIFAEKVNRATGRTAVVLPLQGKDSYERPPDGPWINAEADHAMYNQIRGTLRPDIPLLEVDANINDPVFADATASTFLQLWHSAHPAATPR
ncbi:MAG TPA: Tm-1-like ATP-binding domain-containing protein [Chthoniobacterales bacterium]